MALPILVTNTMMRTLDDKVALARQCLAFLQAGSRGSRHAEHGGFVMSCRRTCAIVPVKALGRAKRRLSSVLPDVARQRLVLTMLEDVLAALAGVESIDCVVVVTPDARVAALAQSRGATVVPEPGAEELNAAIGSGIAYACARGVDQVLVLPADVPLTTSAELRSLVQSRGAQPGVTLAPSHDGNGTNGLLLAPPNAIDALLRAGELSAASVAGDGPTRRRQRRASGRPRPRHRRAGRPRSAADPRAGEQALRFPRAPRGHLRYTAGKSAREEQSMTSSGIKHALAAAEAGRRLSSFEAMALAECDDLATLTALAERLCLAGHGTHVSFSKKVFIPLTKLCRDVCHYCTFAHAPREGEPHYLSPEAVLDIARRGQAAGCKEALFTLGDQPELRYAAAREALRALGAESTLDYLERSAALVLKETGLLPHLNPGVMDEAWLARLRKVSVSQGIMLETASERLSRRGGPHFGSPDKLPAVRLATLEAAGRARVPFTTGILIGIGETRAERIEALLAIRDVHERHGHIQEVIVQNFRAKPGTRMSSAAEPTLEDHAWTIAVARLVLGPAMNIQAPPNLQPDGLAQLVRAGINDWGGVSPVTPDHVNPEAPWPHLADLERATAAAGRTLVERLAIYPEFLVERGGMRPFSPWGEGARRADEGAFTAAKETPPSPVRPNDLQPRQKARIHGSRSERGRKSWPHVLSPGGEAAWLDAATGNPHAAPHGCGGAGAGGRMGAGRAGAAAGGAVGLAEGVRPLASAVAAQSQRTRRGV